MDKNKLIELFEEVLKNWQTAENYVIQETLGFSDNYDHEDLEKEINDYRKRFIETLET